MISTSFALRLTKFLVIALLYSSLLACSGGSGDSAGDHNPPTPIDTPSGSNLLESTAFLYSGANPVQTGVLPGTIVEERVVIVRGRVLDKDLQPISGVNITVLGHPEFGQTHTQDDGMFDMAVNGGSQLTIHYQKTGLLPVQRDVATPWQDYVVADEVIMLALDPQMTKLFLNTPGMKVARGSEMTDVDGTRQATVLFPSGTTASLVLPDGSEQPLNEINVRVTEYTVGENGPKAMPAELPANSGYTYAAEFSLDQAIAVGAETVKFSQPVPVYVDNFLGFPVGIPVPVGYYDRLKGQWIAEESGVIIQVLSVDGGSATLDIDGDGLADDASSIGVDAEELQKLAGLYTAGKILWRVPLKHFSSWDMNWPFGPPSDATRPPHINPNPVLNNHKRCGSVIRCEDQSLGEVLPVTGTPFTLHYNSNQVAEARNVINIPLIGDSYPASLKSVELQLSVAGQSETKQFLPQTGLSYEFVFDGKDAYGRELNGRQKLNVRVGYTYKGVYQKTSRFGYNGDGQPISGDRDRIEVTLWTVYDTTVGRLVHDGLNLPGWSLDVQHQYSPYTMEMLLGNGDRNDERRNLIKPLAGSGVSGFDAADDGGNALSAKMHNIWAMAVGADGAVYYSHGDTGIRRVAADGLLSTVAGRAPPIFVGNGYNYDFKAVAEGGPATDTYLTPFPGGLAMGKDGSLYIADAWHKRIFRVDTAGNLHTVAGKAPADYNAGPFESTGDGGLAIDAGLELPKAVTVGTDGTVYFVDGNRLRRVGTDGVITTLLGNGGQGADCGNYDARVSPQYLAMGGDGSLIYSANAGYYGSLLCKLGTDGAVVRLAGASPYDPAPLIGAFAPDALAKEAVISTAIGGIAVGPDGSVYLSVGEYHQVYRINQEGKLVVVAGYVDLENPYSHKSGYAGDGSNAGDALLNYPDVIAVGANNRLYIADNGNRRIRAVMADSYLFADITGRKPMLSSDRRKVYEFDEFGRHTQTRDSFTGAVRYQFSYDSDGHLSKITDASGNETLIERSGGVPTAIVAPGGQRTELTTDGDGQVTAVSNPVGDSYSLDYDARGLLTNLTEPKGGEHLFEYDTRGRLSKDSNPDGGSLTLTRLVQPQGSTITLTSAEGRAHSYQTEAMASGEVRSTEIDPSGAITVTMLRSNGDIEVNAANGSTALYQFDVDPRWSNPYVGRVVVTTKAGLTRTLELKRSVELTDASNPWSLVSMNDTLTENGKTRTLHYDAASRVFTLSSAQGRQFRFTLDELGRLSGTQIAAQIDAVARSYDNKGRLSNITQGSLSNTLSYDHLNRLISVEDNAGHRTAYQYDAADRMTRLTLPSGRAYQFAYDANGNATNVIMPNGKIHVLKYTANNLDAAYSPADSSAELSYGYNLDGDWVQSTLLDGSILNASYDNGGRTTGRNYSDATVNFDYSDATQRISSIKSTPSVGAMQTIGLSYDAEFLTAMNWTGVATGSFTYGYDNRMQLASIGGNVLNVAITRDDDGVVTKQGVFNFTRNGPAGSVSQINSDDNKLVIDLAYNSQGRINNRSVKVNNVVLYQSSMDYGSSRRLARLSETVNGDSHTKDYLYDADGQLVTVKEGSATLESYAYDLNGNRNLPSATYDAQDRMLTLNGVNYQFNANGMLQQRGSDTFVYSARGELLSATVAGTTVTYQYDGLGRRISRTEAGKLTQYLYANPNNPLQLTASRSSTNVLSVYHYDQRGVLIAIQQGSTYTYVGSDGLGTPRVLADSNGSVLKTISYDSYGRVLNDSDPTLVLPIGFAGGLADPVTGLLRMGFRDYDPAAGRWVARDPALYDGRQLNFYSYVGNDPVNHTDPSGLFSVGGSLYDGVGGGLRLTIDSTGFKICGEVGFGIGGSLDIDPNEAVGDVDIKPSIVGEVGLGPFGAGVEIGGVGDCFSIDPSIKVGPFKGKFEGITEGNYKGLDSTTFDIPLKAEAKIAGQLCGGMKL
ncbi:MAG: hypothetical protein OEW58_05170 [Gammaproteobacteria bacterium]|nr:hypothetical protein [Gammaproteobacteria bacterium]